MSRAVASRAAAALAGVLLSLLPATSAAATDADPLAREPGVREQLSRPPSVITLAFAWELDSESTRIFVLDGKGRNVTTDAPDVDANNVTVRLGPITSGTYSVYYRVNDREGGPTGGAWQFSVGRGTFTDLDTPTSWDGPDEEPKIFQGTDPNQPATDDEPTPTQTLEPGVEVVGEDGTVERFDAAPPKQGTVSEDENGDGTGRSTILLVGGIALAGAVVGASVVARRRRRTT